MFFSRKSWGHDQSISTIGVRDSWNASSSMGGIKKIQKVALQDAFFPRLSGSRRDINRDLVEPSQPLKPASTLSQLALKLTTELLGRVGTHQIHHLPGYFPRQSQDAFYEEEFRRQPLRPDAEEGSWPPLLNHRRHLHSDGKAIVKNYCMIKLW